MAITAAELASFAKRGGTPIAVLLTGSSQADSLASQLANTDIESVLAVENSDFAKHGIPALVDALAQVIEAKKPDANKNNIPDYAEDGKGKNDYVVATNIKDALSVAIEKTNNKNLKLSWTRSYIRKLKNFHSGFKSKKRCFRPHIVSWTSWTWKNYVGQYFS